MPAITEVKKVTVVYFILESYLLGLDEKKRKHASLMVLNIHSVWDGVKETFYSDAGIKVRAETAVRW